MLAGAIGHNAPKEMTGRLSKLLFQEGEVLKGAELAYEGSLRGNVNSDPDTKKIIKTTADLLSNPITVDRSMDKTPLNTEGGKRENPLGKH
jgi:hypothetical protein